MTEIKYLMKSRFLLFFFTFLSFLFFSCKKTGNNDESQTTPAGPLALTLSVAEAAPYQFIRVQLPTGVKPLGTNTASAMVTIGTATVTAYADQQALTSGVYAYSLLMPELTAGSQKVSLPAADGRIAEASIIVKSFTKVADVTGY